MLKVTCMAARNSPLARIIKIALVLVLAMVLVAPAIAHAQDSLLVVRKTTPGDPVPAENFTGAVHVGGWFQGVSPARIYGATVSFAPGARTHWHVHPLGQTLIVTAGTGRVQHEGGSVQEIRPGDVVHIPPGVKHWHGASPSAPMTHVATVERPDDGPSTVWMEAVTDAEYLPTSADATDEDDQPSRAQQLLGDIAPMLADLTDDVLYGQVWASPELSQRDRSLATVSALIALNRPEQLRSHLGRARANGLTEEELVATITHLAFYAGWPHAVTAVGVAREVFEQR